jgi:hypothetical protein
LVYSGEKEAFEMSLNQIADRWRANLVQKLQDRYGLPEEEASSKAEAWLRWLQAKPETPVHGKPSTPGRRPVRRAAASS